MMFALNETAVLYPLMGQRGARPAYAETGTAFHCRSEAAWVQRLSGNAVEHAADTRIFAQYVDAHPGDRVTLNGRCYRIAEVRPMRALRGIHHLEMLAKDEGPCEEDV